MSYAILAFGYTLLLVSSLGMVLWKSDPVPCVMGSSAACEEQADCRPEVGDLDCPGCECDMETSTCRTL